ncbi:ImmA/IrrE family metallo-endopeptidase [Megalodesulfovibrio gigas]|uniref:IrrE N-terminal-like domain-containing protein n=1 Tax=Megalodesulfovibrio gigas (strain ATCC 19364 / DSM 1382 / NCIMB 9332 / VKM B-1759) TaxID=1121448 RepID=T2GC04_MEGG1|nr:ImmA/IrrE family metallo-endopeptidase [Megalodesulfovibrio gigas]AGW13838.1 putative Protein of unknown function [Megalodesulfovibrio gigas DSM 1382 = ATCC 19364]
MARFNIENKVSIEMSRLTSSRHKRFGYGEILLSIDNTPVWSSGHEPNTVPLKWNWLGLLSFLASNWSWIFTEQNIPFAVPPESIPTYWNGEFQKIRNLIFSKDHSTPEKESNLKSFFLRHDLSESVPGIEIPSVFILRTGKNLIFSAEQRQTIVDLHKAYSFFENVGNEIVSWIKDINDRNIKSILNAWKNKDDNSRKIINDKLYLIASMNQYDFNYLSNSNQDYWELEWVDHILIESEIFAAARLSSGYVTLEQQRNILNLIKSSGHIDSKLLEAATTEIGWIHWGRAPYRQGYTIAAKLREYLKVTHDTPVNPDDLLKSWNIPIHEHVFGGTSLEAVACWGKKHGPIIILNTAEGNKCSHSHGRLFTLAHEICHLLVDRNSTLDVCEVLGGATPKFFEKRANAFAAELLFPQTLAMRLVRDSEEQIGTLVGGWSNEYNVTKENISWQILNNESTRTLLESDEATYLKQLTSMPEEND